MVSSDGSMSTFSVKKIQESPFDQDWGMGKKGFLKEMNTELILERENIQAEKAVGETRQMVGETFVKDIS